MKKYALFSHIQADGPFYTYIGTITDEEAEALKAEQHFTFFSLLIGETGEADIPIEERIYDLLSTREEIIHKDAHLFVVLKP